MMAQIRDVGDGIRGGTYTMTAPVITGGSITGATFTGNTFSNPVITGVSTFAAGTVSAPAITTTGDTNTGIYFPAADTIAFTEGGVESMRVTSAGDVGIGTNSPSSILHIFDNVAVFTIEGQSTSSASIQFRTNSNDRYKIATPDSSADLAFYSSGTTERMRITSAGNVGIGTNSPTTALTVAGVGRFLSGTEGTQIGHNGTIGYIETSGNSATPIGFYNGGAERMRIDASGNLMLGTTTSGVAGGLTIASGKYIYSVGTYANTSGSAANMGVAVDGSFFRSTSSLKYKKDVENATYGLAEVLKLRPVTYKGKSETDGDKVFGGLIAEEVHEAGLTEFVQYAEDGSPDALAYGNMVSLAFKAIQEQQTIINDLKARIETLESK
jgi:hypothetical protein